MIARVSGRKAKAVSAVFAAMALLMACGIVGARAGDQKEPAAKPETTKLNIVVTGGDEKKPVDNASVYVKFVQVVKRGRDQKLELNLKTNQEGVTHTPEIPQGKVLIQIVAPGWKTFGQYYATEVGEQMIEIHLERPATKWY
jgi:hypothetical protein